MAEEPTPTPAPVPVPEPDGRARAGRRARTRGITYAVWRSAQPRLGLGIFRWGQGTYVPPGAGDCPDAGDRHADAGGIRARIRHGWRAVASREPGTGARDLADSQRGLRRPACSRCRWSPGHTRWGRTRWTWWRKRPACALRFVGDTRGSKICWPVRWGTCQRPSRKRWAEASTATATN